MPMSRSPRERWRAVVEQHRSIAHERAQVQLHDHRLDRLRTRRARRALVAVTALLAVALPAAFLAGTSVGVVVLALTAGAWYALGQSVRTVADLPEEHLDERQVRVRDRAYVEAYRWLSVLTILLGGAGLLAFMLLRRDPAGDVLTVSWDMAMGVFWLATAAVLVLPSMVLALRESEPPER